MLLSTPSASAQRRRQTPSSLRPLLPTLEKCRHHNLLTLIHYSSSARSLRAVSNMSIAELMLMKAQKMQKLCKLLGNQVWTQNTSLPPPPGKKGFCLKRKCKNLFIDHILLLPFPACPLPNFPNQKALWQTFWKNITSYGLGTLSVGSRDTNRLKIRKRPQTN